MYVNDIFFTDILYTIYKRNDKFNLKGAHVSISFIDVRKMLHNIINNYLIVHALNLLQNELDE